MLWRNPKKQTVLLLYCTRDPPFHEGVFGIDASSLLRHLGEVVKNESCEWGWGSIQGQVTLVCSLNYVFGA